MKRVPCLLLFVSIAFAGCYDVEIDPNTGRRVIHVQREDRMAEPEPVSRPKIPMRKPIEIKAVSKQIEALRVRIVELESSLESQIVKLGANIAKLETELEAAIDSQGAVEREQKALLARIADLEAAIESQRADIENSKNMSRVYELAIESQRLTIETLQKLCRMYEAEIESQRKSRSSEESPLSKEPEAGQQQGNEQDSQSNGVGLPKRL